MLKHDLLYRYLFEESAVRGELVTLQHTYQQIIGQHNYPLAVQALLGEMLAATCLLTATLKFAGDITLQLQGKGSLSLAVVNGNHQQKMRAVARITGEIAEHASLKEMLGEGYLTLTLHPENGEQQQGIVTIEGDTLTQALESYFLQSEQLPTRLFILSGTYQNKPIVGALLLQYLPDKQQQQGEKLEHLTQLTNTITENELFTLSAEEILHRLYHQEEVRLFEPQKVSFGCTCSKERTAKILISINSKELDAILQQDGQIDMHCEYCNSHYIFTPEEIHQLKQIPPFTSLH